MCDHSVVMKGMCALCGVDLNVKEQKTTMTTLTAMQTTVEESRNVAHKRPFVTTSASVAMVHSIPELVVSQERATEIGQADIARLLQKRQLVLLVDLDQTLVHTTNERVPADMKDVHHFQMGNGPYLVWYHTKLRPGATQFLESVSGRYELHIATFGSRLYAHTVARFLDPDKKLFHPSRILSRDECFSPLTKTANLANLFPCGDSLVCIIDDRDEVWNFAQNLIRVRPYFFFANTGDINAPHGSTKTSSTQEKLEECAEISIGHDVKRRKIDGDGPEMSAVEDVDDYLFYLPDILNKIHSTFYEEYDRHKKEPSTHSMPDVKNIVPALKSQVLAGCRIVFSGVVPKNIPVGLSRPYVVAKEFGAIIQDEVVLEPPDQQTTHVIAAYWNTAKVKAAQDLAEKSTCHIVTLLWLWSCSERWERSDERLFPLPKDADSDSAVREDERGGILKEKKTAKEQSTPLDRQTKDEEAGPSTSSEVAANEDNQAVALSCDMIREMNDEVTKALAEEGLSLSSCSSDEDAGNNADVEEQQNPDDDESNSQSSKSGPLNGEASDASSDDS